MKIALINFHYAQNYGAVLQCTALKKTLGKMGCDVSVIDYRPFYQEQYYLPYPNIFKSFACAYRKYSFMAFFPRCFNSLKWAAKVLFKYNEASKRKAKEKVFSPFVEKHLNQTRRYSTLSQLKTSPPPADLYLCGSDQLWNPNVTWGLDPAYFLEFGNEKTRRVAYAISPSKALDNRVYDVFLRQHLADFYSISLREKEVQPLVEELYNEKISICVDPTLLLDAEDYLEFEEEIDCVQDYILVYGFRDSDRNQALKKAVDQANRIKNCVIYDISLDEIDWGDIPVSKKKCISPGQFLYLFKHAAYVVTNSFHGTVFSLIYKRNFLCVQKHGTQARMNELLEKLRMDSNLQSVISTDSFIPSVEYSHFDTLLKELREESISYIQAAISGGKSTK